MQTGIGDEIPEPSGLRSRHGVSHPREAHIAPTGIRPRGCGSVLDKPVVHEVTDPAVQVCRIELPASRLLSFDLPDDHRSVRRAAQQGHQDSELERVKREVVVGAARVTHRRFVSPVSE